jgi:hypothetical protein
MNLWDVTLLMVGIILVPLLYLTLPHSLVAILLALAAASALFVIGEPVLPTRWGCWLAMLALLGADFGVRAWLGATSATSFAVNNTVLVVIIMGIANLWAQSGLKARDAALLAGFLTIYDGVATLWLPTMTAVMERLAGLLLAPLVGWSVGDGGGASVGTR